jgi:uncharacterized protein (DUF1330 family)
MPAYIIAEHEVHDQATYNRAVPIAAAAIAAYGGRYIVNGLGRVELIEGKPAPRRIVVLEFPDLATAKSWYASEEYREAKALRHASATSRIVLTEAHASVE